MSDKRALVRWQKRLGKVESDRITNAAARTGTDYHKMVEYYLQNKLDVSKLDPFDLDAFQKTQATLDKIDNVWFVETSLFSDKYRIAGTVDVIAEYEGVLSIIDHKTSLKPKKEEWILKYFLQETGYAIMFEELTGVKIEQIVTIISTKEHHDEAQVFVKRTSDYRNQLIEMIGEYHARFGS